jgi:hypothetical protein
MGSDASLGFRDLSLQAGDGFPGLAGRTGDLANGKASGFQGLHGVTVLLELNPVPRDVAIVIRSHEAAVPGRRLGLFSNAKDGRRWLTIGKWCRFSANNQPQREQMSSALPNNENDASSQATGSRTQ